MATFWNCLRVIERLANAAASVNNLQPAGIEVDPALWSELYSAEQEAREVLCDAGWGGRLIGVKCLKCGVTDYEEGNTDHRQRCGHEFVIGDYEEIREAK